MAILKFTDQHEWLLIEDDIACVGITGYAQEQLGDVVFVELPETGNEFKRGDEAAVEFGESGSGGLRTSDR